MRGCLKSRPLSWVDMDEIPWICKAAHCQIPMVFLQNQIEYVTVIDCSQGGKKVSAKKKKILIYWPCVDLQSILGSRQWESREIVIVTGYNIQKCFGTIPDFSASKSLYFSHFHLEACGQTADIYNSQLERLNGLRFVSPVPSHCRLPIACGGLFSTIINHQA